MVQHLAAVARFFRKYATFSGRASLSEYWWWQLASFLVYLLLGIATLVAGVATGRPNPDGGGILLGPVAGVGAAVIAAWFLATLVPQLAIAVRRLHDADLSGWMVLLRLVPSVGDVIVIVLTLLPSNPRGARFDRRS